MQNESLQVDGYFRSGILVQPLTLPHMHYARRRGGANFLGLDDEQDPLMRMLCFPYSLLCGHLASPLLRGPRLTSLFSSLGAAVLSIEFRWLLRSHDEIYTTTLDKLLRRCEAIATSKALLHPFRYINYAAAGQDAFALLRQQGRGHRLEEARMLRMLYDPTGFFDRRLNSPFKI